LSKYSEFLEQLLPDREFKQLRIFNKNIQFVFDVANRTIELGLLFNFDKLFALYINQRRSFLTDVPSYLNLKKFIKL